MTLPTDAAETGAELRTYRHALGQIGAMRAADPPEVHPERTTTLITHGRRTERAIVLLHGLTNSTCQWRGLAPHFFAAGYNVFMPRLPHHGYADRMTDQLKNLTAEELKKLGHEVVDIALGLGERVTVVGLSAGGGLAMWLGQMRSDIDLAVGIAPGIAAKGFGERRQRILHAALRALPNLFVWWDPRKGSEIGPDHVYPRFSSHAVAQSFGLGLEVLALARVQPPKAKRLMVIASKHDPSMNNGPAREVVEQWKAHGAEASYHAPDWGLIHDMVDPEQPYAKIDEVYPVLFELIAGQPMIEA